MPVTFGQFAARAAGDRLAGDRDTTERVRLRTGKGSTRATGLLQPDTLRRAVRRARVGRTSIAPLLAVLSLETWLRVRSGQWTVVEATVGSNAPRTVLHS
jgi:hypothetical protein